MSQIDWEFAQKEKHSIKHSITGTIAGSYQLHVYYTLHYYTSFMFELVTYHSTALVEAAKLCQRSQTSQNMVRYCTRNLGSSLWCMLYICAAIMQCISEIIAQWQLNVKEVYTSLIVGRMLAILVTSSYLYIQHTL